MVERRETFVWRWREFWRYGTTFTLAFLLIIAALIGSERAVEGIAKSAALDAVSGCSPLPAIKSGKCP